MKQIKKHSPHSRFFSSARASSRGRLTFLALFLFFLASPLLPLMTSLCVMQVYSRLEEEESLLTVKNIRLHIPGGLTTAKSDWYPFVMTFCADTGFQQMLGNPGLSLTILYNFPAFSPARGCSRLYDANSPYYNSFYGAYLVSDASGQPFGFTQTTDGQYLPDPTEISCIPEYDFFQLVLSEFGLLPSQSVFSWEITSLSPSLSYAGRDGFYRMDATLTVNGSSHVPDGFTPSYLQYGYPLFPCREPLAPVSMYGRLYGTYLADRQVSLFFYIVAADQAVLEECDQQLLSRSILLP